MKSYERFSANFHQQRRGSVINLEGYTNEHLRDLFQRHRQDYPDKSNGEYLAAFACTLWSLACRDCPEQQGEWVVYHMGKGFVGPCFRIAGRYGDFVPDECEFDLYILRQWGLTYADLFEASNICAAAAQKQMMRKEQVHIA